MHVNLICAASSVNSYVLRNMIGIVEVVSPTEPFHYIYSVSE